MATVLLQSWGLCISPKLVKMSQHLEFDFQNDEVTPFFLFSAFPLWLIQVVDSQIYQNLESHLDFAVGKEKRSSEYDEKYEAVLKHFYWIATKIALGS